MVLRGARQACLHDVDLAWEGKSSRPGPVWGDSGNAAVGAPRDWRAFCLLTAAAPAEVLEAPLQSRRKPGARGRKRSVQEGSMKVADDGSWCRAAAGSSVASLGVAGPPRAAQGSAPTQPDQRRSGAGNGGRLLDAELADALLRTALCALADRVVLRLKAGALPPSAPERLPPAPPDRERDG